MVARLAQRLGPLVALIAGLTTAVAAGDDADDQYAVAAGMYVRQQWRLAADEFQAFLTAHPQHPQAARATFFLAESYLQQRQFADAAARYQDYVRREPSGPYSRPAQFRAGESLYFAGKSAAAKTELEAFRRKYPDDPLNAYVYPYLGEIALAAGEAKTAATQFQEGLSRYPEGQLQDDCRLGLAKASEKQGQADEAARLYLALSGKTGSPLAADAQFRLASLQYSQGNFEEAVRTFEAFETAWPQHAQLGNARLGRGWALFKLQRFDEAKTVFQKLVADPAQATAGRYWLGLTLKAQHEWNEASKVLLAAAEADPKNALVPALRFHGGDALLRGGYLTAASRQFELLLSSLPNDNEWADRAAKANIQVALQARDHAALDRRVEAFDARFPHSTLQVDVQRLLARSLVDRQEYQRAIPVLEKLVGGAGASPAPSTPPTGDSLSDRYLLAVAQERLKHYPEALTAIGPVVESAAGSLRADAQLVQGSVLLAMKRFGDATAPLEAVLAFNPRGDDAPQAQAELAVCYARTKQLAKARREFEELLQRTPKPELLTATTEQLSEAALDAGDTAWASELFGRLSAQRGTPGQEAKGLSGVAWSRYKAGRLPEAAELFDQVLQKNPEPAVGAEAALVRGQILEKLDKFDPALVMYDAVIERYPKSEQYPTALLAAARLRNKLQQYAQSAGLFARLAKEYPQLPEIDAVLYDWAWALQDSQKPGEAAQIWRRLHEEYRSSRFWPDATYRLAQREFDAKHYPQAATLVTRLLASQPEPRLREYALYLQGQIASAAEQWDQVQQSFQTIARDFPQSKLRLLSEYWVAEAVYRKGDYDEAGRQFAALAQRAAGQREPWTPMIALRRAQVLAQQKKWSEAHAIASRIETDDPHFAQQYEADYLVGRCLASQADFDGARQAYQKVIHSATGGKTETAAMAQWMIGESYFHQKNYAAAVKEYLRVEILYAYPTWQAGALLQAGKCHEQLGQWQDAEQLYQRLITTYPSTTFTEEARRRLEAVRQRVAVRTNP